MDLPALSDCNLLAGHGGFERAVVAGAGAGAALLPRSLVGSDVAAGRLDCWGWPEGPPTELSALYTSRRLVSPKVKAFVAHLADALVVPGGTAPS